MKTDNPFLGVLLMLGFCAVAPMGDAVAKLLGGRVPMAELLLVRFGAQVLLLLPLVGFANLRWVRDPRVLALTALRTLLHMLGIGMMFTALIYLPLADAVAIAFVMPFIMLLLGRWVLKEEVGPRRLIASIVGFAGTLMVVQPAFQNVGWPALLPVGVAVNFALFMLVTRKLAKVTDAVTLQAVSGAMAVAVLAPVMVFAPVSVTGSWSDLDAGTWQLLALLGALGTLAHLLMTWSLRHAPSATLAPMQYLEIPFATLIGWAVFGDLPNALAAAGILVTVAAGLFILLRERAIARRLRAAPLPALVPETQAT
ncbi:MAG: DMT family transporter [Roseivivax sp.]|nr:DMT family transporter [Roseivivax sp.]